MSGEKSRRLSERTVDYGLAAIDYCERLRDAVHRSAQYSATSIQRPVLTHTTLAAGRWVLNAQALSAKRVQESRVWLCFGERIDPSRSVESLRQESHELMLMLASSIATSQRRALQGK